MRLVGLYGHPVGHSLSPLMHNFAFNKLGLSFHYQSFDIKPEQLQNAVLAIRALDMTGVNVTIPYKESVIPYLDALDESAKLIGAVNTIVNENGILKGYNTDGLGYVKSLEQELQIRVADKRVAIIGSGGAARGIVYALIVNGSTDITILGRNAAKAQKIANDLINIGNIKTSQLNEENDLKDFDIVVNTTPIGMHPNTEHTPIAASLLHSEQIISDIVYNPLNTKLLLEAQKVGCRIHRGLGMFIHQGALAFEKWTGQEPPTKEMYQLVHSHLQNKSSQ
ncbi:shikimate dehydrogenase [Desulfuribacillus alkaliarsenatis]|uniref:Shikimate dehydrogenase (NADP(+)) n=1 Tax=Desulfuribacillus alkaliarsenatis TaxID=766136 RepID=A0A1E5G0M7_9FIRM|nr:shikimate dehydrogenase [Desulfuribacillus alkaliarsenatis]OEF96259.1 shikimate dehydrogenase [Desulfuribacillus alkaliarsenatis]